MAQDANSPERAGPLSVAMSALANAGVRAGLNLRHETSDRLRFEHHRLRVAEMRV